MAMHFNDNTGKYPVECCGFDYSSFVEEWPIAKFGRELRKLLKSVPPSAPKCLMLGACAPKRPNSIDVGAELLESFARPYVFCFLF
jgi:hypothetical protein